MVFGQRFAIPYPEDYIQIVQIVRDSCYIAAIIITFLHVYRMADLCALTQPDPGSHVEGLLCVVPGRSLCYPVPTIGSELFSAI